MRPKLAACMIVKNEEELLQGCLESITNWIDELVIVDTGSTDKTLKIARKYKAKIIHSPWRGDFSFHRNESIDAAKSDWILIIDADERVFPNDWGHIWDCMMQGDAVMVSVHNVGGPNDPRSFLPSLRFFKKSSGLRYKAKVHNYLTGEVGHIIRSEARFKHLGYHLSPEKMAAKLKRTTDLLLDALKADQNDARSMFNLCHIYRHDPVKMNDEIQRMCIKGLSLIGEKDLSLNLMFRNILAWQGYHLKDYAEGLTWANSALHFKSDYIDALYCKAACLALSQDREKAVQAFKDFLGILELYNPDVETEQIILDHLNSKADAMFNLGYLYELMGDKEQQTFWYKKVLEVDPNYKVVENG